MLAARGDSALLQSIYDKGTGGVNDTLLQRYAGGFDNAVSAVFGAGRQYPELERELRINAGRFGTYKTWDVSQRLDKLRQSGLSEDEFKKQGGALLGTYNGYQNTEYNTLVSRARSAKQWERFQGEKSLYPNLEWLHTTSAQPREVHLGYVGLVLPMDDPFWASNQPGNEWGCKCDWRTTDKPTTGQPSEVVAPAQGLDGNPAQIGELVTEHHPYFARNTNAPKWVEDKALLQLPDEVAYTKVETQQGTYREHLLVAGAAEAAENRMIAGLLLANGYKDIKLLPTIYAGEAVLRSRYYGSAFSAAHKTACPDAMVNDELMEFKASKMHNASKRVGDAAKKSNRVLIKFNEPVSSEDISAFVDRQWKIPDRMNMRELLIYANGELNRFVRP